MCRLLGIVAAEPYEYGFVLRDAPRSMEVLSQEHSDGWGVAAHLAEPGSEWRVGRSTRCACNDLDFDGIVASARGRMLIAHVRQKSVGAINLENTHPFRMGRWAFAHNGTIKDLEFLLRNTSSARARLIRGSTDSELFMAWLMTRFDEAGLADGEPRDGLVDKVLLAAVKEAVARPDFGTLNFLLGNGSTLYAHRFGRDLYVLDRTQGKDCAEDGVLGCPVGLGGPQRRCVAIASEPITAEPWEPVPQGSLLRIDLTGGPRWANLVVS